MKAIFSFRNPFVIITLFFLLSSTDILAQNNGVWAVTRQKTFLQSTPVGKDTVVLNNSHGNMELHTWNKDEVKIEALITVSTQEDAYALELLEQINIKEEKNANRISFSTEIGKENKGWTVSKSYQLSINYVVYLPANVPLQATNQYGVMDIVGDFSNPAAQLRSRYGSMTAGKIDQLQQLTIEYGKAKIASLGNTQVNFRNSGIDIGTISGSLTGNIDYCNSIDLYLAKEVKDINLSNRSTRLYFIVDQNKSIKYDIETINAIATSKQSIKLEEEKPVPAENGKTLPSLNNKHHYVGSLGSGASTTHLQVKSNAGSIRIL
jgi:hypothetical protein